MCVFVYVRVCVCVCACVRVCVCARVCDLTDGWDESKFHQQFSSEPNFFFQVEKFYFYNYADNMATKKNSKFLLGFNLKLFEAH